MRNLFLFIEKYRTFLLFLVLEGICLFLVFNFHRYHRSSFLNSANFFTGTVYAAYDNTAGYFRLKEINDSLMIENAELYSKLNKSIRRPIGEEVEVCDSAVTQLYTYLSAKVINNTTRKSNNYITIDIGESDGVKKDMGVIGPNGVIGVVTNVSSHFSSIMSVLHKDCRISAKIKRSNYSGFVSWNGFDIKHVVLNGIPEHVSVEKGDTIVTSGFSSIFPEDVNIGIVEEYNIPKGSNFYNISLRLFTEFRQLRYVYVVNYLYKDEQKSLEALND